MTVRATGKGDFERCLVLLLFLPLAAWSFDASTAVACSSPGSGCAGWGCSPEKPLGPPCDAKPEIRGSPLAWAPSPLPQSTPEWSHFPRSSKILVHLGQLCIALAHS